MDKKHNDLVQLNIGWWWCVGEGVGEGGGGSVNQVRQNWLSGKICRVQISVG